MSNYEATRYDFDGANITGIEGLNTGLIVPWSKNDVPSGFLDCNGAAVSRSTYANLFSVIGTNYGIGDGSTTFNVPDLTDRTCVGKSPTKSQFTTGGANTVTTTGSLSGSSGNTTLTTAELPVHNHPSPGGRASSIAPQQGNNPSSGKMTDTTTTGSSGSDGAHSHSFTGSFTGGADSVLQPYLTIKYIIKT